MFVIIFLSHTVRKHCHQVHYSTYCAHISSCSICTFSCLRNLKADCCDVVLSIITASSFVDRYHSFGGAHYLHLQGIMLILALSEPQSCFFPILIFLHCEPPIFSNLPRRWKQYTSHKPSYLYRKQSAMSHLTLIFKLMLFT